MCAFVCVQRLEDGIRLLWVAAGSGKGVCFAIVCATERATLEAFCGILGRSLLIWAGKTGKW